MEWKEFKIVDIFEVKNARNILKSDIDFKKKKHPYVTAQEGNNSVMAFVSYDETYLDKGNCVFIGGKTLVISYQKEDFFSNDSHNLLLYLREDMSEQVYEFLIAVLYKALRPKYTWNNSISFKKIKNDAILLPVAEDASGIPIIDFQSPYHSNGYIPDWKYMEDYIKELEQGLMREMEQHLIASGLSDYELNDDEKRALVTKLIGVETSEELTAENCYWKETRPFKMSELFQSQTGDVDLQQRDINGKGTFFINSGEDNCGIKGKTDRSAKIFPANTISIDFWGNAYYRDFEYKMATHNHVFSLSGDCIKNKEVGLYLVSQMKYMKNLFSYNNMGTWNKIKELSITLPIITDNSGVPIIDSEKRYHKSGYIPDFQYMESYVKAIEKNIIKNVVERSFCK